MEKIRLWELVATLVFFSLLLIATLGLSFWDVPYPRESYEKPTACRSIDYGEEWVGVYLDQFNGKSINVSRLISRQLSPYDLITSLRVQASPDTTAGARIVVNGRTSDWYYPKIYSDYRDYYTVYCFDDIYTRGDAEIEIQFNSSGAKPQRIVMFVKSRY